MAANVSKSVDDYTWNALYNGHMGSTDILRTRKNWG